MANAPYCYEFPRPMSTVDAVLLAVRDGKLEVLLIKRGLEPCAGYWALPGGFIDMAETLDEAVARELKEETGLRDIRLTQLHTFGDPG
ncbi:MAG: NUDIX domain-containing protein, partial [FCB group bacterium]|nr:NUDIX domain-containing protein [FCB group bacterium]